MNILERMIVELKACHESTLDQLMIKLWECRPCAKRMMNLHVDDCTIDNKLKVAGIDSTAKQRRVLMVIAWAFGHKQDYVVSTIIHTTNGDFERLKELGMRCSNTNRGGLSCRFKGEETEIENNPSALMDYFVAISDNLDLPLLPPHSPWQ